jgi:hypothetical protein
MNNAIAEDQPKDIFNYDLNRLTHLIGEIIKRQVSNDTWSWLEAQQISANNTIKFNTAFALVPRKAGKAFCKVSEEQHAQLQSFRPGLHIKHWTIDRLCRIWLLMHIDASNERQYQRTIENSFLAAEMTELVALYSSLPLFAYPELWRPRCVEGIRSNIGDVLQAIMCLNPYPSEQLNEQAWNQMVLKAFFTEKPVQQIIGLDERVNPQLANTLADYAEERFAAGRSVNPQLWRCIGPFIDERIFKSIKRTFNAENAIERRAAALACSSSHYLPAMELINSDVELKDSIETGKITWDNIEENK